MHLPLKPRIYQTCRCFCFRVASSWPKFGNLSVLILLMMVSKNNSCGVPLEPSGFYSSCKYHCRLCKARPFFVSVKRSLALPLFAILHNYDDGFLNGEAEATRSGAVLELDREANRWDFLFRPVTCFLPTKSAMLVERRMRLIVGIYTHNIGVH